MILKNGSFQAQSFILIGFVIIAYLLFTLSLSVYNDYQVQLRLEQYEKENQKIAADNLRKNEEYLYFNSELFKDKYAKENLNKLGKGEQMLILPEKTENIFTETALVDNNNAAKIARITLLPNRLQWKVYFFGE